MKRSSRFFTCLGLCFLCLGFLGQSPWKAPSKRHVASTCDETVGAPAEATSSVGALQSVFPFLQNSSPRFSAEAFEMFLQQTQFNANMYALSFAPQFSFTMPKFPSYSLPKAVDPMFDVKKSETAPRPYFGGLLDSPQLRYLVAPQGTAESGNTSSVGNGLISFSSSARLTASKF